jgi:hypothetical protein
VRRGCSWHSRRDLRGIHSTAEKADRANSGKKRLKQVDSEDGGCGRTAISRSLLKLSVLEVIKIVASRFDPERVITGVMNLDPGPPFESAGGDVIIVPDPKYAGIRIEAT